MAGCAIAHSAQLQTPTDRSTEFASHSTEDRIDEQRLPTRFNANFLNLGNSDGAPSATAADLDFFAYGNALTPGPHDVEVYVNDSSAASHRIVFLVRPNTVGSMPCITTALLQEIGILLPAFPSLTSLSPEQCIDVGKQMPQTSFEFDPNTSRLNVTIPNAMTHHIARDAVDASEWQNGINAALFDYRLNGSQASGIGADNGGKLEWYGSLRSGINVGPWRFRSTTSINRDPRGTHLQFQDIYARRAIAGVKGELTVGDATTQNGVFDSIPFRGVQLSSDESMEPDSLRGYAPVIRGIAQTHAKVELRQNGFLIYSTYVPPGPFKIDDLYDTAANTDIEVTIVEADGQHRTFTQPFATVPALVRENAWRYSATAGKLRVPHGTQTPAFVQATLAHGLAHEVTVYGGIAASPIYQAFALGIARNWPSIGAVSVDLTHARSHLAGGHLETGQSLRVMYSKSLDTLGTQFRIASYRYSSRGYHALQELVRPESIEGQFVPTGAPRDRFELNISQSLHQAGSLYVNATEQGYWDQSRRDHSIQVGYTNSIHNISYGIDLSYDWHIDGTRTRQIALNVTVPLGKEGNHNINGSALTADGDLQQSVGISGSLLSERQLSYSLRTENDRYSGARGTASVDYRSSVGEFALMHSQSRSGGQTSVEASGGLIVHPGGVTLSQSLGETVGLIAAPGARDVGIEGNVGVHTDHAGYAVVPNLTPYRHNELTLRARDLDQQTSIDSSTQIVTPKRGAVALAQYQVSRGRVLLDIKDAQGRPVPFGSRVETIDGREVGMVGPDGQGFVTGVGRHGVLRVRWGQQNSSQCQFDFDLGNSKRDELLPEIQTQCLPPPEGAATTADTPKASSDTTKSAS